MACYEELGSLNFGSPVRFSEDGSVRETDSDSGSPIQLRKPRPLQSYDREPVRIPSGHPLRRQSRVMKEVLRNVQRTSRLARETGESGRAQLIQSCHSVSLLARSTAGQLEGIRALLDGVEERVEEETRLADAFWSRMRGEFGKAVHPSLHLLKLTDRVCDLSARSVDHQTAAAQLRHSYQFCEAAARALTQGEVCHLQIREMQVSSSTTKLLSKSKESPATAAGPSLDDLHSALTMVQNALNSLRRLSPGTFRPNSQKETLGSFMEATRVKLRRLHYDIDPMVPTLTVGSAPSSRSSSWNPTSSSTAIISSTSVCSLLSLDSTMASASSSCQTAASGGQLGK